MHLDYIPLLQVQRDLHAIPRGMERFAAYIRTITNAEGTGLVLPPLVAMNPMGREHVAALLDELLALDADAVGAQAAAEAMAALADVEGDYKATVVIADDLKGGWTNRYANEFTFRFAPYAPTPKSSPRWTAHHWVTGMLWTSEPASVRAVREAVLTAAHRQAYLQRHAPARTLRAMLAQEGHVHTAAGCTGPVLDADEIPYTREIIAPFLDATDMRTAIECLFGDTAGSTLGFTPRGLSPWAGVALALHEARQKALAPASA